MKTFLLASALVLTSLTAQAIEMRTPVAKQLYTCATGVSRVLATASPPCCDGQLRCAQFLSTTGVLKLRPDPRT